MKSSTKKAAPSKAAKPVNQLAAPVSMPRRGTPEHRDMQRQVFNERFESQKRARS